MKRKSIVELKKIILKDLEHQTDSMKTFEGNENPQIKELYARAAIRAETLKDILLYIENGSKWQFYKPETESNAI